MSQNNQQREPARSSEVRETERQRVLAYEQILKHVIRAFVAERNALSATCAHMQDHMSEDELRTELSTATALRGQLPSELIPLLVSQIEESLPPDEIDSEVVEAIVGAKETESNSSRLTPLTPGWCAGCGLDSTWAGDLCARCQQPTGRRPGYGA